MSVDEEPHTQKEANKSLGKKKKKVLELLQKESCLFIIKSMGTSMWITRNATRGGPKHQEFIYKKLCILIYLNFSHLRGYSSLDTIHQWRHFSHCSNVFIVIDFDAFYCFCLFWFHLFHIGKTFPFENFLYLGKQQKKSLRARIWSIGRVGHGDHTVFGQKLLNTQRSLGRCARKSPVMKWANALKVFK